ncbi:molybdate ABC transporter substrate-binding protein [Devosia oryzisoli]|uniref:molybdate ABC transporter substrate-binding protein n=1 Tax=Devosia oryzisoli TaxID=2774138 RepID=UPI003D0BFFC7
MPVLIRFTLALVLVSSNAVAASAESVTVAVAANFTAVAEDLAKNFAAESGHEVKLSFGATGQLYAQISQGAPFKVFLAADVERPQKAMAEGLAVKGSFFVYAQGRLTLYGPGRDMHDGKAQLAGDFGRLAIADPETAPYGAAAVETLKALGLYEKVQRSIVEGENISQTLQFVDTGNAELGFVAASQVLGKADQWLVPPDLHAPIAQGAVLLEAGRSNPAARAFLAYLRSEEAMKTIEAAGYAVP